MAARNPTLDLVRGDAPRPLTTSTPGTPGMLPEGVTVMTPSELLFRARSNVEHIGRHGELYVEGELSGHKIIVNGHRTFDLKDRDSALPCFVGAVEAKRIRFELRDGMKVVVIGTPTVTRWSKVQLKVTRILPGDGEGAFERAFRELKEKLDKEGLLDEERKRSLPLLPRVVGVVTSTAGAAMHDVIQVLWQRMPGMHIVVSPTKVQGEGASREIGAALEHLDRSQLCDVILLVRGGGSRDDLWAFNEEPVARAIAASSTPVISGVGHQTDITIADLVADKRAATPSNAAELAVPRLDELHAGLHHQEKRLASLLRHALANARVRLDQQRKRLVDPRHLVAQRRRRVDEFTQRLERALRRRQEQERARVRRLEERLLAASPARQVAERRARLAAYAARLTPAVRARRDHSARLLEVLVARLSSISPLTVLARGYAIARRVPDGTIVRSPHDAPPGTKLAVRVEGGTVRATVDEEPDDAHS